MPGASSSLAGMAGGRRRTPIARSTRRGGRRPGRRPPARAVLHDRPAGVAARADRPGRGPRVRQRDDDHPALRARGGRRSRAPAPPRGRRRACRVRRRPRRPIAGDARGCLRGGVLRHGARPGGAGGERRALQRPGGAVRRDGRRSQGPGRARRGREGLRILVEFLPGTGIPDLPVALDLVRAVGGDHLGVMLDTWHLARSGAVPTCWWATPPPSSAGCRSATAFSPTGRRAVRPDVRPPPARPRRPAAARDPRPRAACPPGDGRGGRGAERRARAAPADQATSRRPGRCGRCSGARRRPVPGRAPARSPAGCPAGRAGQNAGRTTLVDHRPQPAALCART